MAVYLESNITYILIITTTPLFKNRKGQISLIIQGPSEVNTRRIRTYFFTFVFICELY